MGAGIDPKIILAPAARTAASGQIQAMIWITNKWDVTMMRYMYVVLLSCITCMQNRGTCTKFTYEYRLAVEEANFKFHFGVSADDVLLVPGHWSLVTGHPGLPD